MPTVMESSMFCFGISRIISNYTSMGFDLVTVGLGMPDSH